MVFLSTSLLTNDNNFIHLDWLENPANESVANSCRSSCEFQLDKKDRGDGKQDERAIRTAKFGIMGIPFRATHSFSLMLTQ
jgi:hypothetical protein